jgi:hypothetical protein
MDTLVSYIHDLSLKFVQFHYEKYLDDANLKIIPHEDIPHLIDTMYVERLHELKEFLRLSLKEIFQSKYNPLLVETTLSELDKDCDKNKHMLISQISHFQSHFTN